MITKTSTWAITASVLFATLFILCCDQLNASNLKTVTSGDGRYVTTKTAGTFFPRVVYRETGTIDSNRVMHPDN